jgi:hypothetical protein
MIDRCIGTCNEKPVKFYITNLHTFHNIKFKVLPFGSCASHTMDPKYSSYYNEISYEEAVVYEVMQS